MATVLEHYAQHLAPTYEWMCGGFDAAAAQASSELQMIGVKAGRGHALDLGCGFGAHAITLARMGFSVDAVDTSTHLLSRLGALRGELPVHVWNEDMTRLPNSAFGSASLVLCMGDTLPHLESKTAVATLVERVALAARPNAWCVMSFRDYTRSLEGEARFIDVRSDDTRIHTCFLEDGADFVMVNDLIHERVDERWELHTSSYRKLKLPPAWVEELFTAYGFHVDRFTLPRGMVALRAIRAK